jgi:hypothetical protein
MKKILLTLAAITALWTSSQAQTTGGPDAYGYIWRDSNDPNGPTYSWIDITTFGDATTISGLSDDNNVPATIGFPFRYYWYDVNNIWIGSNGYIGFTNSPIAAPIPTIPSAAAPNNYIAPFACDLNFDPLPGNTAQCWKWKSADNDTLIISWINAPFWANQVPAIDGSNTFQLILSTVDSSITFQYQSQIGTYQNPTDYLTLGIENNSGNVGLLHSHDAYPVANYAVKYYYPANSTFQVSDASASFANNPESGGLFLSKRSATVGGPFPMSGEARNSGNTPLASFNIGGNVKSISNANQGLVGGGTTTTYATAALTPGQTEAFIFPKSWQPATAGTFTFNCTTQLTGDATPTNNAKSCELVVVDTALTSLKLTFDGNVAPSGNIAWSGGNAGVGVEIPMPYTPCKITTLHAFIAVNTNNVSYYLRLYDNSGVNGGPGALLDSVFVDSTTIVTGVYSDITLTVPVTVTTSSVFLEWFMGGDGIGIGTVATGPFSNRTYEVFGGNWSIYRTRETTDFALGVSISDINVGINTNEDDNSGIGNFYPNPTNNNISIRLNSANANQKVDYKIYDMRGQIVAASKYITVHGQQTLELPIARLSSGVYNCIFNMNGKNISRQFNVVK